VCAAVVRQGKGRQDVRASVKGDVRYLTGADEGDGDGAVRLDDEVLRVCPAARSKWTAVRAPDSGGLAADAGPVLTTVVTAAAAATIRVVRMEGSFERGGGGSG